MALLALLTRLFKVPVLLLSMKGFSLDALLAPVSSRLTK